MPILSPMRDNTPNILSSQNSLNFSTSIALDCKYINFTFRCKFQARVLTTFSLSLIPEYRCTNPAIEAGLLVAMFIPEMYKALGIISVFVIEPQRFTAPGYCICFFGAMLKNIHRNIFVF